MKSLITKMDLSYDYVLSSDAVRGLVVTELRRLGENELADVAEIVGPRLTDVMNIWGINGDTIHDNANLDASNQETMHKRCADIVSEKAMLKMLPDDIVKAHLDGILHIHDREYFFTRQFCLPEDELVLVKMLDKIAVIATKEASDVFKQNKELQLFTPRGWKKVKTITERTSPKIVIRLETKDGRSVRTTPEHRIMLSDNSYKEAYQVKVRDELLQPLNLDHDGNIHLDNATAQFIGLFIAEGHYNGNSKDGYRVFVSGNDLMTMDIVKSFANLWQYHVTESIVKEKTPQYIISKKELYDYLKTTLGIKHGALNKCLPAIFWELNSLTQSRLIGAMFKGDGSVFYDKKSHALNIYYKTSSPRLAHELALWLHMNGISCRVREKKLGTKFKANGPSYAVELVTSTLLNNLDCINFIGDQENTIYDFLGKVHRIKRKPIKPNIVTKVEWLESKSEYVYDFVLDAPEDDLISHQFVAGTGLLVSNCFDSDLRYILYYGLYPDGTGRTLPVARAARSAEVAFLHAAKALGSSQCNCAGGQGYQAFNVFIAPYLFGKSYKEIKQLAQLFVFEMGQMTAARGAQAVFSSIQLFPGVPSIWKDKPIVAKGLVCGTSDFIDAVTYGQYERETRLLFKSFMEVFYEGDSRGRPFSFPKPEIVIGKEFIDTHKYKESIIRTWEEWREGRLDSFERREDIPSYEELYRLAFKLALKNGAPYFESQYNISNPLESISCVQCCAYGFSSDASNDTQFNDKLNFRDGAHFDSLGSMQVVSLNLPRAAYQARDYARDENGEPWTQLDNFESIQFSNMFGSSTERLKRLIDKAVEIFRIKRDAMSKQASPFMRQTPIDPNDQAKRAPPYCNMTKLSFVVGVVGLNEYVQILTGKQLHESEEAVQLGERLLGALNIYCGKVGHENNMTIALARTPAETTAQRFAVSDLLHDLKAEEPWGVRKYVKGNVESAVASLKMGFKDVPIEYSNGTHCAVDAPISITRKAEIEGRFFDILKGGNIFHIWLGDLSPFYTLDTICDESGKRIPKEPTESDIDHVMEFGLNLAKNTSITYFAFSKDMTICLDCNATSCGIREECPRCKSKKVDAIARITGYYGAVSGFNEAKKEEVRMRHRTDVAELTG